MGDLIDGLLCARIGNYVLVREIGRATHYTLFQAVDPRVGRMVLIKILHVSTNALESRGQGESSERRSIPREETARESAHVLETRLQREAEALTRLSHPSIVTFYENGEHDGFSYLVMEYLYGHPLRQHLDQRALPLDEAVHIMEQLAGAVDAVHAQGILHRDLRPSNVMILRDGSVKLVDFGLARQPGDTTVTLMGQLVGEPTYMAPEQLQNKPASPQSDLWALGVLLYEMVAGQPPFQGANFQLVAHQVLMGEPAPVPGVSPAIQAVLDRALEKDPEKRYPCAGDMMEALRKAVGTTSQPTLRFETARPRAATIVGAGVGAGVLAIAASILVGIYLARLNPVLPSPVPTAAAATLPAPVVPAPVVPAPVVPAPVVPAPVVPTPVMPPSVSSSPLPQNFSDPKKFPGMQQPQSEGRKTFRVTTGSVVPPNPNVEPTAPLGTPPGWR